jgi:hypothetical protein
MGTESALIEVCFYDSDGNQKDCLSDFDPIEPDDVLLILIPSDSHLGSGEYSAVVSSNQPLATLSDFSDEDSGAAYSGFNEGSTKWYIPGLHDNYFSYYSNIYAQNTSSSFTDIQLEIYAPNNPTPVYSDEKINVPPYASVKWDLKGLAELESKQTYGGIITSNNNVVVIANIYGSGSTAQQLYSYNAYKAGAKKWYMPSLVKNYYGWNASIIPQNISDKTAHIKVKFSTGYSKSYTLNPYSSTTIYIPHLPLPSGMKGLFAATITSDVDIVVMVNQSNKYNRASTYNAFSEGSTKVFAPGVMKRASIFSTSVTCQNVGEGPTRMKLEYSNAPNAGSTSPMIQVGDIHLWYQPISSLPNGYDGSAVITSLDNQNIACIINRNTEDEPYFSKSWDMYFAVNGINQ